MFHVLIKIICILLSSHYACKANTCTITETAQDIWGMSQRIQKISFNPTLAIFLLKVESVQEEHILCVFHE